MCFRSIQRGPKPREKVETPMTRGRNPYVFQVNSKSWTCFTPPPAHHSRVVIPMCFRSIQRCRAIVSIYEYAVHPVVIPMCFRSIQRNPQIGANNVYTLPGRNPYVFQVNSKDELLAATKESGKSFGRNPYVFQVNSKFSCHNWNICPRRYYGRNPYVFQVNSKPVCNRFNVTERAIRSRNPYVFQVNSKQLWTPWSTCNSSTVMS